MSKEEAWEVMAVEILTDAGLVAPNHPEGVPVPARTESIQVSIEEAKLLRPLRIEPEDDDRIRRLLVAARSEGAVSREDRPSMSSIARRALRLGIDELERRNAQKTVSRPSASAN